MKRKRARVYILVLLTLIVLTSGWTGDFVTAQTVSGTLTEDETWSGTIGITGDVTVPYDITLTINPGTVIEFTPLSDDTNGGADSSRCELIINEGTIYAAGMIGNEIIFTSAGTEPAPYDWYGIRFIDSYDPYCELQYCDIQWAYNAVSLSSSSPTVSHCTIGNNHFRGITGTLSSYPMTIENNEIFNSIGSSEGCGIYIDFNNDRAATISGNNLYGHADCGIYFDMPYVSNAEVGIEGNEIHDNEAEGVYVALYGSNGLSLNFKENLCYNNADNGYYFTGSNASSAQVHFFGCETYSNESDGIYMNSSPGTTISMMSCAIYDNESVGVYFNQGHTTLAYCDVYDNYGHGVRYHATNGVQKAYYSNLYNNVYYEMYNNDGNAIDARFCWWGATATAEMNSLGYTADISRLYDIHDNADRGMIDYRNWSGSQIDTSKDPFSFISSPSDGASLHTGEITIEGIAGASSGVFWVELSTDGGANWFQAEGKESWSFTWNVSTEGTYDLVSRAMDEEFQYETPGAGITVDIDDGAVTTSGTVVADQTWDGAITVTGDVKVPEDVTLTILPGTVITFAARRDDAQGGVDNSRCELIIQGALNADGSAGSEIVFTSDQTTPATRDWYGIRFDQPYDAGCLADYCDIQWAESGIMLETAAPTITNNYIANHQHKGITGVVAERNILIHGNEICYCGSNSSDHGINLDLPSNRTITVSDNHVHEVNACGLYVNLAYESDTELILDGNIAHDNTDDGINIPAYGSARLIINVKNSGSYNNDGYGFYFSGSNSSGMELNVSACDFHYNDNDGWRIMCSSSTSVFGLGNVIYHNQGYGVYLSNGQGVFVHNSIHTNISEGVYLTNCNKINRLYYNNIYGNNPHEIHNDSSIAVDARNCWWGEYTTVQMNAWGYSADIFTIYDIHDDGNKGMVDYRGWKTEMIETSKDPVSYIADPMDGMILPVGNFTVKGIAGASAGVDFVEFSKDGGSNWMLADGKEQWTYDWAALSEGAYLLQSRVTDEDAAEEVPEPGVNVVIDSDKLHTWGTLYQNEVWSGSITISGDVTIPEGRTLTILPGTNITINALRDDSMSGTDTSRIEFIVKGSLIADGTSEDMITFTIDQPFPEPRDWYGIRFLDQSNDAQCTLNYCDIKWGVIGVSLHTASPNISNSIIGNHYSRGISGSPSLIPEKDFPEPYDLVISSNEVFESGTASGYGIYLECTSGVIITLNDNIIHHNLAEGLFCNFTYLTNVNLDLMNNEIHHNGDDGMQLNLYGSSGITVASDADVLYSNTECGAYVSCSNASNMHLNFVDCGFNSNDTEGIYIRGTNQTHADFNGCSFHHNEGYGVYIYGGNASFSYCSVYLNDDYGIRFRGLHSIVSCSDNNINDNYDYEIYNDSSYSVTAMNCWWGITTTAEMDELGYPANIERLYDIHDNASYGEINYDNWIPGPVPTVTPSFIPTATPVMTPPTAAPTREPTSVPTAAPTATPQATNTPTLTAIPTNTPIPQTNCGWYDDWQDYGCGLSGLEGEDFVTFFVVHQHCDVTISINNVTPSDYDPILLLLDGPGAEHCFDFADEYGAAEGESITITAMEPGTYYAVVDSYENCGFWNLTLSMEDCVTPTPIPTGTSIPQTNCGWYDDWQDYGCGLSGLEGEDFVTFFVLNQVCDITLTVDNITPNDYDPILLLLDGPNPLYCFAFADDNGAGQGESINIAAMEPGNYYAVVDSYEECGYWNLSYTINDCLTSTPNPTPTDTPTPYPQTNCGFADDYQTYGCGISGLEGEDLGIFITNHEYCDVTVSINNVTPAEYDPILLIMSSSSPDDCFIYADENGPGEGESITMPGLEPADYFVVIDSYESCGYFNFIQSFENCHIYSPTPTFTPTQGITPTSTPTHACTVLHVPQDFLTIQEAVDAAMDCDTVLIDDGTFTGDKNRNIDLKFKAITVTSANGAENCIIDCQEAGRGFIIFRGEGADTILNGLTVRNAAATFGAGIYIQNSSPTISDCIVSSCMSESDGGGVYCSSESSPLIQDCTIVDNSAGGIGGGLFCRDYSNATITNSEITGNDAEHGGGVYIYNSTPHLTGCLITENYGDHNGGVYFDNDSAGILESCIIARNSSIDQGGGLHFASSSEEALIKNCLIIGNITQNYGGGAQCWYSNPTLLNCTLSENSAGIESGALNCFNSAPVIKNSICWNNSPDEIGTSGVSVIYITYSNVQGGFEGEGNMNQDPLFVAPLNDDFHLQSTAGSYHSGAWEPDENCSPAIDAGDPADPCDNEPSPHGNILNMGAYGNTDQASKSCYHYIPALSTAGLLIVMSILGFFILSASASKRLKRRHENKPCL